MRAAIYDPYLDTLGGGERYAATVAEVLESLGYETEFWWGSDYRQKLNDRFGLNLKTTQFVRFDPLKTSLWDKLKFTSRYDLILWVSDGSIPVSLAKKTIIHMQIPAHWKGCGTISNRLKAKLYPFVCNSLFTKSVIDGVYKVNSKVLYPPVATELFPPKPKKNIIASVGRLAHNLHAKRQDVLIEVFAKMSSKIKGWKLVLAGGSDDIEYLDRLSASVANLDVEIIPNPTLAQIRSLLGEAKLFWSATGFEVNPRIFPEKMEHFGIATVEAMSAGAVPLVTRSGGHLETVVDNKSGYWWGTIDELVTKTRELVADKEKLQSFSKAAIARSKSFSKETFYNGLANLI